MANPLLVFQGGGPPEGSANRSCGSSPTPSRPISYGIPTFKLHGTALLWFARWKAHCSIYPLTDSFLAEHADELEGTSRLRRHCRRHWWRNWCAPVSPTSRLAEAEPSSVVERLPPRRCAPRSVGGAELDDCLGRAPDVGLGRCVDGDGAGLGVELQALE